jgi:carbon-monoxide dehydrogenase medium subunit
VATIGGHLAHADPHMDLPPILLGMDARVHAVSPRGGRWVSVADLITGYYQTSLAADELLTEVLIPAPAAGTRGAYVKVTSLSVDDWPAVCGAAFVRQDSGRLADVRLTLSAATERPVRLAVAEQALNGQRPSDGLIDAAAQAACGEIRPLADLRGSAAYKRELARALVRQALHEAMNAPARGEAQR